QAQRSAGAIAAPSGPTLPVEGRILDLEGRPVVGAKVRVKYVQSPPGRKLDAWIDEGKRPSRRPYTLNHLFSRGSTPRPVATTGRDGRFRILGLPRGTVATADITGPDVETSEVYILVEDVPTIRVKDTQRVTDETLVYYGAKFDHAAAPARPIV